MTNKDISLRKFKETWSLLNHEQKKHMLLMLVLMLLAMLLESLSVGIVFPLISILLKGDIGTSFFSHFFVFGEPAGKNLIYIGLSVTFIIFLVKNLTLVFNLWKQTNFLRKLEFEFTNRLFQYYLKKDYIFFLNNNSAYLYRNLTEVIGNFVSSVKGHMILLSEITIFIGIAFVLFYVDFLTTIIILISVGVFSFLIYISSVGKIFLLGKERNLFKTTGIYQMIQFITGLPRFSFEMLMICTFSAVVLTMIGDKKDMIDIIQYLSVFAIASFRVVPAVARILNALQNIKYMEPSVKILINELDSKNNCYIKQNYQSKELTMPLKFQKEINLKNLSFSYPIRKEFSVSKLSMTINKGDFIGIIGETGSGKSTLINLLIGLLKPAEGKVEVDELNINSSLPEWYKKIGYVPQSVYLTDDTIRKNIAFGLREDNIDDDLIKQAVEKASLNNFLNELSDGLETIVGEKGIRLSGGQQQRIGIARALYRDPEILILDEATSSLDQSTEKKIMESIQYLKRKKTLIVVTHRLITVKNCDKIFIIDKGKITKQGTPEEILNNI